MRPQVHIPAPLGAHDPRVLDSRVCNRMPPETMNTPLNDGGTAFPVAPTMNPDGSVWYHGKDGMTLRDWFAGQALIMLPHHGWGADLDSNDTAMAAYQVADAMLAARKGGEP